MVRKQANVTCECLSVVKQNVEMLDKKMLNTSQEHIIFFVLGIKLMKSENCIE